MLCLFGMSGRAQAEIVYLQSFTGSATSGTSVTVTTNNATTHGDLLVAVVSVTANVTLTAPAAISETGYNNAWTFVTSSTQNSGPVARSSFTTSRTPPASRPGRPRAGAGRAPPRPP